MKKPNYSFEKKQREAAKEKKRAAKRLKKQADTADDNSDAEAK